MERWYFTGFVILVGWICYALGNHCNQNYISMKIDDSSPMYFRGKFIRLLSEEHYLKLEQDHLRVLKAKGLSYNRMTAGMNFIFKCPMFIDTMKRADVYFNYERDTDTLTFISNNNEVPLTEEEKEKLKAFLSSDLLIYSNIEFKEGLLR